MRKNPGQDEKDSPGEGWRENYEPSKSTVHKKELYSFKEDVCRRKGLARRLAQTHRSKNRKV
jgi:hypothetical protein